MHGLLPHLRELPRGRLHLSPDAVVVRKGSSMKPGLGQRGREEGARERKAMTQTATDHCMLDVRHNHYHYKDLPEEKVLAGGAQGALRLHKGFQREGTTGTEPGDTQSRPRYETGPNHTRP